MIAHDGADYRAPEGKKLVNEQPWGALDNESLSKTQLMAYGWKGVMSVSLILIALFLTLVTMLISCGLAHFTTAPQDNASSAAKNQLPSTSTQLVALFKHLTVIVSVGTSPVYK
ncbi:hypothetical protein SISNIDRAFT_471239 [Sistotremastrum niveocremeum HHB9708]|uniref:Uncharacterized protein n=1 Tax=Sistotremastrum niveocremeum HHB9708 TaxID=1314777 RepID=A0A164MV11_9AGAM|nr:hypothetical protein SISNIDRAFT_471239 [Sistotremastrum niveocremeum HHB9708]